MVLYAPPAYESIIFEESELKLPRRVSRRLPAVPSRQSSFRPLPPPPPPVPAAQMTCRKCKVCITSKDGLLPDSQVPSTCRARKFSGLAGKASLFTSIQNVKFGRPSVQLMVTGAHTLQEIHCSHCNLYLGWKIIKAHEKSEKWKEGHCLLELESLHVPTFHSPPRSKSF